MDFQAMMCGCLVLKPEPQRFVTYPSVFVASETVLPLSVEWGDLHQRLLGVFQVGCMLYKVC